MLVGGRLQKVYEPDWLSFWWFCKLSLVWFFIWNQGLGSGGAVEGILPNYSLVEWIVIVLMQFVMLLAAGSQWTNCSYLTEFGWPLKSILGVFQPAGSKSKFGLQASKILASTMQLYRYINADFGKLFTAGSWLSAEPFGWKFGGCWRFVLEYSNLQYNRIIPGSIPSMNFA